MKTTKFYTLLAFLLMVGVLQAQNHDWPIDLWTDVVTEQPEGYVVDAFGDVHIYSAEGLAWLSVLSNGLHGQDVDEFEERTVYLEESIDLAGHVWTPIAAATFDETTGDMYIHYFKGAFDGKQHLIDNLLLYKDFPLEHMGLFGIVKNGVIRNVIVENCRLEFNIMEGWTPVCGVLAYHLEENSMAENCYAHCLEFKAIHGGLFYGVDMNSSVTNCMVRYDFKYEGYYGCGISDFNYGKIINCASVIDTLQWPYLWDPSGVASENFGQIENCYSYWGELVEFPFYAPYAPRNGVAYFNDYGVAKNCYYNRMPQVWQFDDSPGHGGTFQDVSQFDMENDDWQLMNPIIIGGTTTNDLVEVLNLWIDSQPNSDDYLHWCADTTGFNHGLPIFADNDLTSIEEQCENVNAIAYPNPGKDVLNIRTGLKDARVEVYDMNGRLVHSQALTENVTAIDAADWAEGVYVWKVYTSQAGPSTLRVSSGTTGSATLAETGKWVKE